MLMDPYVGNVEGARRMITPSAWDFVGLLAPLTREKGEGTQRTSSRWRLVQRREGDNGERFGDRLVHFCRN